VGNLKTASFHVRASQEQAERWNRAAAAEGHRAAGTWLADAADSYLKAKPGQAVLCPWHGAGGASGCS
jgi:hypothetical protein